MRSSMTRFSSILVLVACSVFACTPEVNASSKTNDNSGIKAPAHAKPRNIAMSPSAVASAASDLQVQCDRHFPSQIQGEIRSACASAGEEFQTIGKSLAEARCRLDHGDDPRLVMACLIGVSISTDLTAKTEGFKRKLQLCAEHYPAHTEVDAFLQESCLTGIYLPEMMKAQTRAPFESCGRFSPERSFIGPCSVGISLAASLISTGEKPASPATPAQQNRLCEQYFDHKLFHIGYRYCLSARGIPLETSARANDALKECTNVITNTGDDTERAACIVGLSIFRHLERKEDVVKRFEKCGDSKVSFQDRNFLACLTAASLVELSDKTGAQSGCREVFRNKKTRGRNDCLNALNMF